MSAIECGQIRTALNSTPLIDIAATAEKKAFAKVRIVFSPAFGRLVASVGAQMVQRTKLRNCEICDKCCGFCNRNENARLLAEPGALFRLADRT